MSVYSFLIDVSWRWAAVIHKYIIVRTKGDNPKGLRGVLTVKDTCGQNTILDFTAKLLIFLTVLTTTAKFNFSSRSEMMVYW